MRGVVLDPEDIEADVEGVHAVEERVPVLKEIRIHYRLRTPPGSGEIVDRALARHVAKCPTACSLAPAVAVTWTADVTEREPS